jgi:hypothetical protein
VAALCQSKHEINENSLYARRAGVSDAMLVLNDSKDGLNDLQVAAVELAQAMTQRCEGAGGYLTS